MTEASGPARAGADGRQRRSPARAVAGATPAEPHPLSRRPRHPSADDEPSRTSLTGPIVIDLPELPEVGIADRLGLGENDEDDTVGSTS